MNKGVLHCDGASSGNPGAAGIGVVIQTDSSTFEISEYIGIATNNIAEYSALIKGLSKAKELGIDELEIFLDSELIVKQINGSYKVKNEKLKSFHEKAVKLLGSFQNYSIKHVPREQNKEADKLAKEAVKSAKAC